MNNDVKEKRWKAYDSLDKLFDNSREDFDYLDIDTFDELYGNIENYIFLLEKFLEEKESDYVSW